MASYHGAPRQRTRRRYDEDYEQPPRDPWAAITNIMAVLVLLAFGVLCFWWMTRTTTTPLALPQALPTAAQTYLQNVGAQAPHSPRSQPTAAPVEAQAQPQPQPAADVAPPAQDAAPIVEAQPIALPTIEPAQAEVIGARQSNGCAPGQVFMPRSGCHTPGSGGAMPGPVGGAK